MNASIVKAFKNDGCMEEIRTPRRRLAYLLDAADELQRRIKSDYGWSRGREHPRDRFV